MFHLYEVRSFAPRSVSGSMVRALAKKFGIKAGFSRSRFSRQGLTCAGKFAAFRRLKPGLQTLPQSALLLIGRAADATVAQRRAAAGGESIARWQAGGSTNPAYDTLVLRLRLWKQFLQGCNA